MERKLRDEEGKGCRCGCGGPWRLLRRGPGSSNRNEKEPPPASWEECSRQNVQHTPERRSGSRHRPKSCGTLAVRRSLRFILTAVERLGRGLCVFCSTSFLEVSFT